MRRVRPIPRRKNRVGGMAFEQFRIQIGWFRFSEHSDFLEKAF
jgi:hypothetical protein